jgi:tetratricopeptide (TPR) repeat protein
MDTPLDVLWADPRMKVVWGIALVVSVLTFLVSRGEQNPRSAKSSLGSNARRGKNHLTILLLGKFPRYARALQLLDRAIEVKKDPRSKYHAGGALRASRALALAMFGRVGEAAADLQMAIEESDPENAPELAGTCWRSGVALLRMEREDAAFKQFELAKQIDPKGLYGSRSASALREHSVMGS